MYWLIFYLLIVGCVTQPESEFTEQCSDCKLEMSIPLPIEDGVYLLTFDRTSIQTFARLDISTDCGWSEHIQYDTDYQYRIGSDWVSLVNPASMTDDDGYSNVMFGVWKEFIGTTITCYGGYTDDCGNQHIDSLKIKIL